METETNQKLNRKEDSEKRFFASAAAVKAYEEMREELRGRGQKDFQFARFIDAVIEKVPEKSLAEIIESFTPDEYWIRLAMKDPEFRKKVLVDARKTKAK